VDPLDKPGPFSDKANGIMFVDPLDKASLFSDRRIWYKLCLKTDGKRICYGGSGFSFYTEDEHQTQSPKHHTFPLST
jgi:hypothetical protein